MNQPFKEWFINQQPALKRGSGKMYFNLKEHIDTFNNLYREYPKFTDLTQREVQTAVNNIFNLTDLPIEDYQTQPRINIGKSEIKQLNTYLGRDIYATESEKELLNIETPHKEFEFIFGSK